MSKLNKIIIFSTLLIILLTVPSYSKASSDLKVAGWIPYWRTSEGIKDAKKHLNLLDYIYPFVFTVKSDGSLSDQGDLEKSSWQRLFKEARTKNVKIIPTVMWSNGALIQTILSDQSKREDHIDEIVNMVEEGNFDGVDIDYEAKQSITKDYFSLFLKELKEKLPKNTDLVCTIEARTPPQSLYRSLPPILSYANDYTAIGEHCDIVQIMAYDQQRADLLLNDVRKGAPYAPTADVEWVRKVVELTIQSIPKEKIMLGIPTYGAEYEVTVSPNWYQGYKKLWSLNPEYGVKTAKKYKIKPSTNSAGELAFSYIPKENGFKLEKNLDIPNNTPSGLKVATEALAQANKTGQTIKFNYVSWSDAKAVKDKVDLAKSLDLRGVSIFKIDGGEDKNIWKLF